MFGLPAKSFGYIGLDLETASMFILPFLVSSAFPFSHNECLPDQITNILMRHEMEWFIIIFAVIWGIYIYMHL